MISEQVLRKYYESTMKVLRYCSRHKGTKKVRETSDIVACHVVNEILERTKILHHENFRNFVFFVDKIKKNIG